MDEQLTPLSAVVADDPYPYYARLVCSRPFAFDERVGAWVAASAAAVDAVLEDDALHVRPPGDPIPKAMIGTPLGDAFGRLARMTDGERHDDLKRLVIAHLTALESTMQPVIDEACADAASSLDSNDATTLNAFIFDAPAAAMASLVGIENTSENRHRIGDFARALAPGSDAEVIARGSTAAEALLAQLHTPDTDVRANLLGFLFQAYDATAATIANLLSGRALSDPVVHNTRRFVGTSTRVMGHEVHGGDTILVLLAAAARDPLAKKNYGFGGGSHRCPGQLIAEAIARSAFTHAKTFGFAERARVVDYRRSLNVRIPVFALSEESAFTRRH